MCMGDFGCLPFWNVKPGFGQRERTHIWIRPGDEGTLQSDTPIEGPGLLR